MILELSLKPKEWHPLGQHKRLRCRSIREAEEQSPLMLVHLEMEWDGHTEQIYLSTDQPDFFIHGLQFIYKGGWQHEAQVEVVIVD